jgi:uncharacterized membrane protein
VAQELSLTLLQFLGLLNSVAVFPPERDIFFHEYNSSAAYSAATFTLATTLVEAPFTFVANLVRQSPRRISHAKLTTSQLLGLLMNLLAGLTTSPRIYFQFVASTFAVQSMGEVGSSAFIP